MAGGTVLTATQTETALDSTAINPTQTQNRAIVHVTLVFDGVTFDPAELYDALDAQWGTVASEKNHPNGRGTYVFNIAA